MSEHPGKYRHLRNRFHLVTIVCVSQKKSQNEKFHIDKSVVLDWNKNRVTIKNK